jgi:hypothetical protein
VAQFHAYTPLLPGMMISSARLGYQQIDGRYLDTFVGMVRALAREGGAVRVRRLTI